MHFGRSVCKTCVLLLLLTDALLAVIQFMMRIRVSSHNYVHEYSRGSVYMCVRLQKSDSMLVKHLAPIKRDRQPRSQRNYLCKTCQRHSAKNYDECFEEVFSSCSCDHEDRADFKNYDLWRMAISKIS